jgi:hypothetical protein
MVIRTLLLATQQGTGMGDYDDKRGEFEDAGMAARALVGVFLRQLDTACTCTVQLYTALSTRDRGQVLALMLNLYRAWSRASARIVQLEALSGTVEVYAREALGTSHALAAEPLARAEALLRHGHPPSAPAPGAPGLSDSRDYD